MEWLNYHHLLYFWTVAREGSIARACEKLRLAQPTISGQLRALEESIEAKLFARAGRGLKLTDTGQLVYRYADEIFGIGRELQEALEGRPTGRPVRLTVGIAEVVPKLVAYRLLEPALSLSQPVHLICQEDKTDKLLAALSNHEIDLVLTDAPIGAGTRVRAYSHLLGASGAALFAAPQLAERFRDDFPACLDGAPFLLPMDGSALRRGLDEWFEAHGVRPRIIGEFQDNALLKVFGQAGAGVFAAPTAIEREVQDLYRAVLLGRLDSVTERFYAVSVERRLKHPAVVAISEAARAKLFREPAPRL
ncbi:MAG TPA: transcriptional activator NhaR [Bryobacteraceae bacterium]|nr:transcriptional activator NhaR [Bryobacteraceae bacterium]